MRIVYGFTAASVLTVIGFWPSFFSNPMQNDLLHSVHGVFATGWMLILILQAWLMATGRLTLHHWIGRLSPLWVLGLLVTAVWIVFFGLSATGDRALPMPWRPVLAFIDLISLPVFVIFYGMSLWCALQRKIELHYRFMICTLIVVISPAVGRAFAQHLPGVHGLMDALHPTFWFLEVICVALLFYDYVRVKTIYPPYWLTLLVLVVIDGLMFRAPQMPGFMNLLHDMGLP
jgi:hypothetical protein